MIKWIFGVIGLVVMGENFVFNVESWGFFIVVFNCFFNKIEKFMVEWVVGKDIKVVYIVEEFV